MSIGLVTDLYELTMAASYLRHGLDGSATFSLFCRRLPPQRGFLVAAGLHDVLRLLPEVGFDADDEDALRALGFDRATIDGLRALRFTGEVWAVPEGRVVFPDEPLIEVTAPLAQAQLVETLVLNQVTYQTALATKAARCRLAAAGRADVVDFALRRTHGVEAGMAAARAGAIAGFAGTSNVQAARRLDLPAMGTMAHSYVEAFASEREAFRTLARDFPDRTTFLVDTYDTISGTKTAIEVITELGMTGPVAVRLDSGDLLTLSHQVRRLLDGAGCGHVKIVASGGLDEWDIDRLLGAGAPIDLFGVGTKVGVSADAPSLDTAYKLVEYDGRPVMKLSPGKETMPGAKQVFRRDPGVADVLGTRSEPCPPLHRPLLQLVMRAGRPTAPPEPVAAAAQRLAEDLDHLPAAARRLDAPVPPPQQISGALRRLTDRTRRLSG